MDNEHLGKKSSKCCCIYHKPRAFGESSSESSADDSDDGSDDGPRLRKKKTCPTHGSSANPYER